MIFFLDQSKKDVEAYSMADGQYLVLVDGLTQITCMQETADSYRYVKYFTNFFSYFFRESLEKNGIFHP